MDSKVFWQCFLNGQQVFPGKEFLSDLSITQQYRLVNTLPLRAPNGLPEHFWVQWPLRTHVWASAFVTDFTAVLLYLSFESREHYSQGLFQHEDLLDHSSPPKYLPKVSFLTDTDSHPAMLLSAPAIIKDSTWSIPTMSLISLSTRYFHRLFRNIFFSPTLLPDAPKQPERLCRIYQINLASTLYI